jgi:uncharacterized protein (TIGR00255 family)
MPQSMTGFGRAVRDDGETRIAVTMRSVNHKGLKLSVSVPDLLAPVQAQLEARVRERLERGSVKVDVRYSSQAGEGVYRVNRRVLRRYMDELTLTLAEIGGEGAPLSIEQVATLPGVIEAAPAEDPEPGSLLREVLPVLDEALDHLEATRRTEGEVLVLDLTARVALIRKEVAAIEARIPEALQAYLERARSRIATLLEGLGVEPDEATLARELALFADKTDVSEELTRLIAHLDELTRRLASEGPVGRRLDFLAQEIHREANTLASKGADASLLDHALEIKVEAGRIKEQVQNLQ